MSQSKIETPPNIRVICKAGIWEVLQLPTDIAEVIETFMDRAGFFLDYQRSLNNGNLLDPNTEKADDSIEYIVKERRCAIDAFTTEHYRATWKHKLVVQKLCWIQGVANLNDAPFSLEEYMLWFRQSSRQPPRWAIWFYDQYGIRGSDGIRYNPPEIWHRKLWDLMEPLSGKKGKSKAKHASLSWGPYTPSTTQVLAGFDMDR